MGRAIPEVTTQWERTNRENRLQADSAQIHKRIADRLLAHQEALQSLRRFIESAPELTSSRFDAFTLSILQDNPEVSTLSFNALVPDAERPGFEQTLAAGLGRPDFRITELGADGTLTPAGRRKHYVPITYIVPQETNMRAIGFDNGICCFDYKLVDGRPVIFELNPRFGASLVYDAPNFLDAYAGALRARRRQANWR